MRENATFLQVRCGKMASGFFPGEFHAQAVLGPELRRENVLIAHNTARAQRGEQESELYHVDQQRSDAEGEEREGCAARKRDQRKVAEKVFIPFTVGGGIRTVDDFKAILREGADKVAVNSAAIMNPILISEAADKFGRQCVVVAIDAKRRADGSGWNIFKNGGRVDMGIDAVEWAMQADKLGAGEILLTSMDCDGTKNGYDIELTRMVSENVSVPVIASGGAGKLEHFYDALEDGKADAALAASLFHFKELEIREVKQYLRERGVSVRL